MEEGERKKGRHMWRGEGGGVGGQGGRERRGQGGNAGGGYSALFCCGEGCWQKTGFSFCSGAKKKERTGLETFKRLLTLPPE